MEAAIPRIKNVLNNCCDISDSSVAIDETDEDNVLRVYIETNLLIGSAGIFSVLKQVRSLTPRPYKVKCNISMVM